MDRLQAMKVFTKVVEMNSFSRAADSLALPRASATTMIKNLEAHLRVRLMQRTTRRLNLTPEGAEYYERCVEILARIDETEDSLANTGKSPQGSLRLDMPVSIGKFLVMPQLSDFRERYPDVNLLIGFGNRRVDLVMDGVDCAIRVGELEDSSLIARRLGSLETITAASPAYLGRHGTPQGVHDLSEHIAVKFISSRTGRVLDRSFSLGSDFVEIKMAGNLAVNDAETYVNCGLEGMGIVQAPRFMLGPLIRTGKMVQVLSDLHSPQMPISAVYPQNRHLAPKVRVFVDWIALLFETCASMTGDEDRAKCGSLEMARPDESLADVITTATPTPAASFSS